MQNKWIILVAILCGAVAGALIARYGMHITSTVPAFAPTGRR